MRVLNMWGKDVSGRIADAVPGIAVVVVDDTVPDDLRGDVLFASWYGHPIFERLDAIGVEWMHLPGTGIDGWPRAALEGRVVTCSRGVSGIPIAEFVLASMLAFAKRLPDVWISEPPKHWNFFSGMDELAGKTLGLIGLGGIGAAIARRARAFDMRVIALRRTRAASPVEGVELAMTLTDVVSAADHLVVAAPATPRTTHLLDTKAFEWVKPGVHLVNIARGALIDQDALRVALDDGRVALATLDTVEPEPLPAGHWLFSHPQVRLSAHVSWGSPKTFDRIIELFVENLRRHVAGQTLEGIVDLDEGY